MALTYTPEAPPTFTLPDFTLRTVDDHPATRAELTAQAAATLVVFICNHCPYVRAIEDRLIALAAEFRDAGLATIAICSNDPSEHPEDAAPELLARWRQKNYGFPYLIDVDQTVTRAFGAVCTPDFFLFDRAGRLVYRGRLDDAWREPARVRRRELAEAVGATLGGRAVDEPARPAMGCSIKWLT